MKIEVLGTGCAKCNALENAVRNVANEMAIDYTLEHVKDIVKITDYGVLMTPALVVDGDVKFTGKVPGADEIRRTLEAAR